MTDILAERRQDSAYRIAQFQQKLTRATAICAGKACVYVTGSFGRGEASKHSDLDLFIVGRSRVDVAGQEIRELTNLDETLVKAELIDATRAVGFPDFSGDGEYLEHYTIDRLVKTTGKPEDDATNTFTARLLLLLESRPLLGDDVYEEAIRKAIAQYWRDYKDHEQKFVPGFLANDILRLWRTFCVNYEARTSDVPEAKKNKRRLKNYKLKYSRMLTCYSALIHLLVIHKENGTVTPDDIRDMVARTPTERLQRILEREHFQHAFVVVQKLLDMYAGFLENTNASEQELLTRISDKQIRAQYFEQASAFGDAVFELIELVGQGSRLHRLLVV